MTYPQDVTLYVEPVLVRRKVDTVAHNGPQHEPVEGSRVAAALP